MTEILSSAQMRGIEALAIESGSVTGLQLMERAGAAVLEAIFAEWPDLGDAPKQALVLCGPGNNGGDGFVIARLLAALGWTVQVVFGANAARLPADALENHRLWTAQGTVCEFEAVGDILATRPVLIIDALFGTGLSRPLSADYANVLKTCAEFRRASEGACRGVAVDIPSGLCADNGVDFGTGLPADLTVTFHCAKLGHYLTQAPECCGRLVVADIGLPDTPAPDRVTLAAPAIADLAKRGGHKFSHGHALVVSGGPGRGGAARLAAKAALRVGAGLVTIACPLAAQVENAARLDEVMLRPLQGAVGLRRLLTDPRLNALCLGPGMGLGEGQAAMVGAALNSGRKLVLDADALTLIARNPALFSRLHSGCVLTPHSGEFARLFPMISAKINDAAQGGPVFSKVDAVRGAAKQAGCVVLLKGADTVIAGADGRCSLSAALYDRAAPWLATAGSGDVLAGLITGLLARGFDPMRAAETGAWLHVEAARIVGPGLIAGDLPEALPAVFRALGV